MKRTNNINEIFLIIVFILSFQFSSYADDVSDYHIEGISVGDSLLKFLSLEKINNKINSYDDKGYIYKSKKYFALTFDKDDFNKNLELYDQIQFHFKDKDNTFTIESVAGIKLYRDNIYACYSFLEKRENEADKMFSKYEKFESKRENDGKWKKLLGYFYELKDKSTIYIACEDWTEQSNIPDDFVLVLNSFEHQKWVNNEAY